MSWTPPRKTKTDPMTLITRVSWFFLIALGGILLGYSGLLYGLSRYYLYREFDQRIHAALNTLVAAVEVESDDVKWEPSDHTVTLGSEHDRDDARWIVVNEQGLIVDQSENLSQTAEQAAILDYARHPAAEQTEPQVSGNWRFLQSRLAAVAPKPVEERDVREHAALVVTVARSTATLNATLNRLAGLVLALSIGGWSIAAVCGRWFCRKALEPVGLMAASARTMGPANPEHRLPIATTGDELSDLGQAFNNLLDQLFQAYERQQRFTGDAAHQLRTPLTVLQGQIEVALRRPRSPVEYSETLDLLHEQVVELRKVIESLLFLARPEGEGNRPELTTLNLSDWLTDYLAKWKDHARFADLQVHAEPGVTAVVSAPLLGLLLDNLTSNALKYSQPGSAVMIDLRKRGQQIALQVIDHGIGIATEDIPSVFDLFFRSQNARQSGVAGTGLGLPLAARVATSLDGQLECASVLNEGSQFTLVLPARTEQPASAAVDAVPTRGR